MMRRGDWYGSSELWCMMGPSSNDVDFTAWLLGSLQAKRCVRPVNRVRVWCGGGGLVLRSGVVSRTWCGVLHRTIQNI